MSTTIPTSSCFTADVLREFLAGGLTDAETGRVSEHLNDCAACGAVVERLADDDELRKWVQNCGPIPAEPAMSEGLRPLVAKLVNTPPDSATPAEVSLSFLGPPEHSGDVGTLAHYRVQQLLACGGMGVVLKGHDTQLGRAVAIKVLRPDQATAANRARFVREGQAAAGIKHSNLVTVFAVSTTADGLPYLVMEYVAGPSLHECIRSKGQLDADEVAQVGLEVAEGLGALHQNGLVHRDIKPQNIILEELRASVEDPSPQPSPRKRREGDEDSLLANLRAKIVDFGLAKSAILTSGITRERVAAGTVEYISPEQITDPAKAGARSDVYALGMTMYEAITGVIPFRGTPQMVVKQLLEDDPTPPRRLNDTIARDLETIIVKCLEKDPCRRYADGSELADELRRFLRGEPIRARPIGTVERTWRWCQRNRVVAGLLAALVVVFLGGFSGVVWQWLRAEGQYAQANVERDAARQERLRAEQKSAEAAHEREQAERERQRAEANFQKAQDAVDQMLTHVGVVRLAHVPQFERVRKELLEEALKFYLGFLQERATDPALQFETARAYLRVGKIRLLLGKNAEAEEVFVHGTEAFEKLVAEFPEDIRFQKGLGDGWSHLANLLGATNQHHRAEQAFLRAEGQISVTFPEDLEQKRALAALRQNRAHYLQESRRYAEAETQCRSALNLQRQLVDEFPENLAYMQDLANGCNTLSIILRKTERLADAKDSYLLAITLREKVVGMSPEDFENRMRLATVHRNLGRTLRESGETEESIGSYRRSRRVFEQLVNDYPNVPSHHGEFAETLHGLAMSLAAEGERAEVQDLLERAIRHQRRALGPDPTFPRYRAGLRNHLYQLAALRLDMGEHREAAKLIVEMTEVVGEALDFLNAARFLASCVSRVKNDERLPDEERLELIQHYTRRAVELLGLVNQKGGSIDAYLLKNDTELAPLRSDEGFVKLVGELELRETK